MKDIKEFPVLYSKTKNGKIKEWAIFVKGNSESKIPAKIISITGFIDGKMTTFETVIETGKNIGKKNETNPFWQAVSEAESKWNKKKDGGYSENKNGAPGIKESKDAILLPMLALKYQERGKDIVFPCFVQPKVDGLRATLQQVGGELGLYSRLKNEFPHLDHILNELRSCKFILDGELYSESNEIHNKLKITARIKKEENVILTFQEINGLVRKKTLTVEDQKNIKNIIFLVYDICDPDIDFAERHLQLTDYFAKNNFKYIKLLETSVCKTPDLIDKFHDAFVLKGHEGLIIRNKLGGYTFKHRSKNLQKYKNFQDAEFEIIGFKEGESSTEAGAIIWICRTKKGGEFSVRPKGSMAERRKLYKNGGKYIGEWLIVTYFDLTDDGIPFHLSTPYGGEADIRSLHL